MLHAKRVATSIQETGAILHHLPYRPYFKLLEKVFVKVKASNKMAYQATNPAHLLALMAYNTVFSIFH